MSGHRDQNDTGPRRRTEPTLGDIGQLDAPPPAPPVPSDGLPSMAIEPRSRRPEGKLGTPGSDRRGWLIPLLLLLVILLATAIWVNQGSLRALLPRTEFNSVLARAQAALQAGDLDGQNGTSARELFQAAVALEPDNDRARNGLQRVGQAELAQADAALQAGRIDQAAQQAAVARELLGGGSDIDRLDRAIDKARVSKAKTGDLIDQAQQAFAAGNLTGDHGAGGLYQQVLQADPENAVAAHGLDQVGDALAAQAHQAFATHDTATANTRIDQLAALQPNNGALPSLRALQAQTRQQNSAALDAALTQGTQALRDGRISGAGDDTALAHFKAALALDPTNPQARAGLGKVAQALTVQANAAIDAGDRTQAKQLLDQAAALAPKSADLAAAQARLASAVPAGSSPAAASTSSPGDAGLVTPMLSAQQQAVVAGLIKRAREATREGHIMLPPGASAYDLYRNALSIDGNNVAARQGLQGLPAQVEKHFRRALSRGNLRQAGQMLDNLAELSPGDAAQVDLSNQLATAWLDQAEQQLARGDRSGARQSLERARKLAPNHPRVQDLTARLQGGS
ncbi:MAG: hypothetical protein EPN74_14810 [Rhodanobacter sp.]|nr:MAG: hypothetical protein EPN74_14810 [Rhodanobacter sp.]